MLSGYSSTKQSFQPSLKGREPPGYGRVKALRVLVYARLKGLNNDTRVVQHLKKHNTFAELWDYAKYPIELLLADGGDVLLTF